MRKPIKWVLPLLLLIAITAACGSNSATKGGSAATEEPSATPSATPEPTEPAKKEAKIDVFFADKELNAAIKQQADIAYSDDADLVEQAVKALQAEGEGEAQSLWKPIELLSVKLDNGLVTVDIHLPDEARLGAPGEAMVLDNLEQTLFQFDFVQSYDLLVDGQPVETLMGHIELEHPTLRSAQE
ncbi:GerMN domain-containing protein [Paenibacillus radicis (ex Gao et al. 2016)]|uniref:GerMN domain-containing protein n=1 Tax=Paenibacillus radicis (ex Gao et al. 2016) TaxID=1737354 RepID=A0A917GWP1_9BACL|nr:GerMN domain-containing protein [Paenibacillus radicis (ex Gao et al. 2016)]GGG58674.1 hypothetical protein GCM10010918_09770 [Paenibacillus radicis (ex Gao et al. 2016)]